MAELTLVLGIGAAVLLVGRARGAVVGRPGVAVAAALSGRSGWSIGECGPWHRRSTTPTLTQALGLAALVLILTEGGLTTRWSRSGRRWGWGSHCPQWRVVVSVAVTGTALHYLLGFDWRMALLWGAVLSPDRRGGRVQRPAVSGCRAAAHRRVGAGVRVQRRARLHRGGAAGIAAHDHVDPPLVVVYELARGALIGAGPRLCSVRLGLRRAALPATGLYPLATVAVCVVAFPRAISRTRPGSWPPMSPRCSSATPGCRTGPTRSPSPKGSAGCADRAVRVARPVRLSRPAGRRAVPARWSPGVVLTFVARPLSVVLASRRRSRCPGGSRCSCRGQDCAVRCPIVLALIPLTPGVAGGARAGRRGVRAGHRADGGAGQHPAVR